MEMDAVMKHAHSTDGFTLVESLVAIALLAMAMLAMAPLFVNGMKMNSTAFDKTMANTFAKEKLEEALLLPSGDPKLRIPAGSSCYTNDPRCAAAPFKGCPCVSTAAINKTLPLDTPVTFYYTDKRTGKAIPNPYNRYLTVQEFNLTSLTTPLVASATNAYAVKRVDVYVTATRAGLLGLSGITETGFVRNTFSFPPNLGY
jgi:prepilin-type N-terminal cleavage/methylation domain-containing protein